MQQALSARDGENDHSSGTDKSKFPNPVIVSMLALPLLQILSLPQTVWNHGDSHQILGHCQTTARDLLSVVACHKSQLPDASGHGDRDPGCHGDRLPGALPSAASHTCSAYAHLATYISPSLRGGCDVADWLQQVRSFLSSDGQHSRLLTLLVSAMFIVSDDESTLDNCLQLLHTVCQSDKTTVIH